MHCPNCQKDVEIRYGYCSQCGAWLEDGPTRPRVAPKGGTVFDAGVQQGPRGRGEGPTVLDPGEQQGPPAAPRSSTVFDPGVHRAPSPGAGRSPRQGTVFDPAVQSGPRSSADVARAPGRRLVGWLVTFSHLSSGQDYRLLEGRNVIGSEPGETSIEILEDPHVSGKHAVIMFRDGQFLIRDADSSNGTLINGKDIFGIGGVVLKNGDVIRCGSTELKLYAVD